MTKRTPTGLDELPIDRIDVTGEWAKIGDIRVHTRGGFASLSPRQARELAARLSAAADVVENPRRTLVENGLIHAASLSAVEMESVIDSLLKRGDPIWKKSKRGLERLLKHRDDEGFIAMKHLSRPAVRAAVMEFVEGGDAADALCLLKHVDRARRALDRLASDMREFVAEADEAPP